MCLRLGGVIAGHSGAMREMPIGWYRVPGRPRLHRFWNGNQWVEPVETDGDAKVAVLTRHIPAQVPFVVDCDRR